MNSIKITLKQLLILINFSAIVPIVAVIVGFVLASHSNSDRTAASVETIKLSQLSESLIVEPNEIALATLDTYSEQAVESLLDEPLSASVVAESYEQYDLFDQQVIYLDETPHLNIDPVDGSLDMPFAIQVGIFSGKQRAVILARELQSLGSEVHVFSKRDLNSTRLYSVIVGLFRNKDEAKDAGAKFTENYGKPHYVTGTNFFQQEIGVADSAPILAAVYL